MILQVVTVNLAGIILYKSLKSFQTLFVMNGLDFFLEGLGHSKTKEILQQENVPFSFLARKIGR